MRIRKQNKRRRATVLLMVVSLLALLFVLVTGYLSVSRSNRAITEDVRNSDYADDIADSMIEWSMSLIKDQIVGSNGKVMSSGAPDSYSFEDIPGYRHSNYLASLEPVWDAGWNANNHPLLDSSMKNPDWDMLGRLCWPAVTSLDAGVNMPTHFPIYQLMRDFNPGTGSSALFSTADAKWNARIPFMDADGDGVVDSHFLLCAPGIEAANSMSGTPVQLPRYDLNLSWLNQKVRPFFLLKPNEDATNYAGEIWNAYDENARYETAVRIISHGGMVTLDAPPLDDSGTSGNSFTPFNRRFEVGLFDEVSLDISGFMVRPNGSGGQYQHPPAGVHVTAQYPQDILFEELHANRAAVENALRRRFLLPQSTVWDYGARMALSRVPSVLAELQGMRPGVNKGFYETFMPVFRKADNKNDPSNWQRINIGGDAGDEREGWARAVSMNATDANQSPNDVVGLAQAAYSRRQLMTTVNYSDDLARKQTPGTPYWTAIDKLYDSSFTLNDGAASLYDGELKYYLGEVTKAFDADLPYEGCWKYNPAKGGVIIEQLARFYYDMLSSHSDPSDPTANWGEITTATANAGEVVSRRQQALMLAVNTVSFAAPRCRPVNTGDSYYGKIDSVYYRDIQEDVWYTGYAPQPFITEVISYDPTDDGADTKQITLAIKIFNPHAPQYRPSTGFGPPEDEYALNLSNFGLRVAGANDQLYQLTGGWLNGYDSHVIELYEQSSDPNDTDPNTAFTGVADERYSATSIKPSGYIDVYLVRLSNDLFGGCETIIDTLQVKAPDGEGKWASAARDTKPEPYYNWGDFDLDGANDDSPRWGVATAIPFAANGDDGGGSADLTQTLIHGQRHMYLAGATGPVTVVDPDTQPSGFAPRTPLITMNASPNKNLEMFGNAADGRPPSFPTVGFLLFLPRYAHAQKDGALHPINNPGIPLAVPPNGAWPLSATLYNQWQARGYSQSSTTLHPTEYPADFGHMPIFDNSQSIDFYGSYQKSVSTNRTGVPWGLMVFDYFTTINPAMDRNNDGLSDVDPLRIPGRININTAPWTVLANIPMIGPLEFNNQATTILPLAAIPPDLNNPTLENASPEFWDPRLGVLAGQGRSHMGTQTYNRLLSMATGLNGVPRKNTDTDGLYRLGPWLAQSIAAYRDGIQYVDGAGTTGAEPYADTHLRDGVGDFGQNGAAVMKGWDYRPKLRPPHYNPSDVLYGNMRGASNIPADGIIPDTPADFGFISVGELSNVKGFDSTSGSDFYNGASVPAGSSPASFSDTTLARGDFVKAVSLLALIDSQYLTTRSNTFTIYTSIMDREDPQASIRTQTTVDRSNLLPELEYGWWIEDPAFATKRYWAPGDSYDNAEWPRVPRLIDMDVNNVYETLSLTRHDNEVPSIITQKQSGYFSAEFDD